MFPTTRSTITGSLRSLVAGLTVLGCGPHTPAEPIEPTPRVTDEVVPPALHDAGPTQTVSTALFVRAAGVQEIDPDESGVQLDLLGCWDERSDRWLDPGGCQENGRVGHDGLGIEGGSKTGELLGGEVGCPWSAWGSAASGFFVDAPDTGPPPRYGVWPAGKLTSVGARWFEPGEVTVAVVDEAQRNHVVSVASNRVGGELELRSAVDVDLDGKLPAERFFLLSGANTFMDPCGMPCASADPCGGADVRTVIAINGSDGLALLVVAAYAEDFRVLGTVDLNADGRVELIYEIRNVLVYARPSGKDYELVGTSGCEGPLGSAGSP